MKILTARVMVVLWMLGFAGAFLIQSVFQTWFAEGSYWGANTGWQTEIAIWNAGILVALAGLLRSKAGVESYVLPGLAVLSLCFGINHALAVISSPSSPSNWTGAVVNGLAVLLYASHLIVTRKSE
jgi:hypothetical protein